MGDFHQNGVITTLHNLCNQSEAQREAELMRFKKSRPMSLVLPSLYSELQTDALAGIVDELTTVPYLNEIVVGLDRASQSEYEHALQYFSKLPQHHRVLWNEGPRLQAIDKILEKHGLAPKELGKGRNVWYCLGFVLASGRSESVALHDCDIKTYQKDMLARLIYPVANPNFNYEFCKGYYARIADGKMNGRVTRLLVTPLLRALKKVCGHSDFLEFLDSFRYPLAGEFSFRLDVISDIRIPSDWGLDRHAEERTVELFAANVMEAGSYFLENPMDTPFIPSWNRVISAIPDIGEQLVEAVEADHKQYFK